MMKEFTLKSITAFEASDGRVFMDQQEAEGYEANLQAHCLAGEYVATLGLDDRRHATRLINEIAKFELWRAAKGTPT